MSETGHGEQESREGRYPQALPPLRREAALLSRARPVAASGGPMAAAERRGWAALLDARCGSDRVTARRTLQGAAPPPPAVRPRRGRVGAKSYEERED